MQYFNNRKGKKGRAAETVSIKDAMHSALKSYRLDKKYLHEQIKNSWEEMVGKTVASRTTKMFVSKEKLYVEINSAPLKNELSLKKKMILEIVQSKFGEEAVSEIIFI